MPPSLAALLFSISPGSPTPARTSPDAEEQKAQASRPAGCAAGKPQKIPGRARPSGLRSPRSTFTKSRATRIDVSLFFILSVGGQRDIHRQRQAEKPVTYVFPIRRSSKNRSRRRPPGNNVTIRVNNASAELRECRALRIKTSQAAELPAQ
jgi:hypothetical protein